MKLKSSTLFLILTAIALGGIVLVLQSQVPPTSPSSQSATDAADPQNLFAFQESQVQSLSVQTPQQSLKFQRGKDGKWQMLEPEKTAASDASIAFLLNLLATGKSQRSFAAPASDRQQYSFQQPLATVEVTLDNKETHKLVLGGYDFNRSNLYALADPPTDAKTDLKVLLIPPTFEKAVSRPLAEWQQSSQPPAAASPTPASPTPASPAESPAPASPAAESPAAESPSPDAKPTAESEPTPAGAASP
ncbi:MAG TPA: DUF4340 domain-containing protein [Coleofasciculaceae cyanobacterium]